MNKAEQAQVSVQTWQRAQRSPLFTRGEQTGNFHFHKQQARLRRWKPAHVVGVYILNIQEEEHGLHKTAGCGTEQCRRKLRSRLPVE